MPIHTMNFENGVFYAKQVGYFDSVDVTMWANALSNHAKRSGMSIMVIMDVTQVDRMCPTMTKAIKKAAGNGELLGVAIIASEMMASRNERVMSKLGALENVRLFNSMESARVFIGNQVNPSFGGFSAYTAMRYMPAAVFA